MNLIHELKTRPAFLNKLILSLTAGLSVTLALTHHFFNFWGIEFWKSAVILAVSVPLLSFGFFRFLSLVWAEISLIARPRWRLTLIPALALSGIFAYALFKSPLVWHTITITPLAGRVELYEIKTPPGRVAKFSGMNLPKGWSLQEDRLVANAENAGDLTYSFIAPIGQPVELLFGRSPSGGEVEIRLGGSRARYNLRAEDTGLYPKNIVTSYKLGIPAALILIIIFTADFLAVFSFILAIWLIQEIPQRSAQPAREKFIFSEHRINLLLLIGTGAALHIMNFLSVPLITASDSPSYLSGVLHWLAKGDLDGVPAMRGPGTTFLFIPIFQLFGLNPAGVKLLFHSLALGVIPILYLLGWKLYQKRALAFLTGLVGVFMPELYLYANFVHHDVPSIFFITLYSLLLLAALEEMSWRNLLICFLTGSFFVLLRPENLLLLAAGMGFIGLKILWEKQYARLKVLLISAVIAALPLLMWSAHNSRVHGFFGISNYFGMVFFDGWIYYGEASGFHISDQDSLAVQAIHQAIAAYGKPLGETVAPTGPEVYPALLAYGYTHEEAMSLLGDAAKDSLLKDPALTWRLYLVKIRKAFIPPHNGVVEVTYTPIEKDGKIIGAEPYRYAYFKYYADVPQEEVPRFNDDITPVYAFIPWQQKVYDAFPVTDNYIYRPLVFFSLIMAFFALYQKQFFKWVPFVSLIVIRMFFPISVGNGQWSFMLAGIAMLLCCAPLALAIISKFIVYTKKSAA